VTPRPRGGATGARGVDDGNGWQCPAGEVWRNRRDSARGKREAFRGNENKVNGLLALVLRQGAVGVVGAVNGVHSSGRDTASARWRDRCGRSGDGGWSGSSPDEMKWKRRQFAPQAGAWRGHEPPSPRRGASCRRGSLSAKLLKPASGGGDSVRRRRVRVGGRSGD